VIKTTVFMSDVADFARVNAVYKEFFTEDFPARAAYQVQAISYSRDSSVVTRQTTNFHCPHCKKVSDFPVPIRDVTAKLTLDGII
jgi:enamine deaminase RidA (YjgF/YER057c/UK114 family)